MRLSRFCLYCYSFLIYKIVSSHALVESVGAISAPSAQKTDVRMHLFDWLSDCHDEDDDYSSENYDDSEDCDLCGSGKATAIRPTTRTVVVPGATSSPLPYQKFSYRNPLSLGLDKVKQYAGYGNVRNNNSLFFWFVESRNDPSKDPIILWLNGGPGCSSFKGLFWVNGPSNINSDLSMTFNPYSWNNNASVLYLDEPAGTGLSTVSKDVVQPYQAAEQVYDFLDGFYKEFPQYQKVGFHLGGQSDAGHYIAATGAEILQHPDRLFNFTSLSIGNGLIDTALQYEQFQPFYCGNGGHAPILSKAECDQMAIEAPKCVAQIRQYNQGNFHNATDILRFCNNVTFRKYKGNFFDIDHPCPRDSYECYPPDAYYQRYMNQQHVLDAVGARKPSFQNCNMSIVRNWGKYGGQLASSTGNLSTVLQHEVPILLFAGDADATYGWMGNREVAKHIEWPGRESYNRAKPVPWVVDSKPAGEITNYDKLTFVRFYNCSHLISVSNPPAGLSMINNWLWGNYKIKTSN